MTEDVKDDKKKRPYKKQGVLDGIDKDLAAQVKISGIMRSLSLPERDVVIAWFARKFEKAPTA